MTHYSRNSRGSRAAARLHAPWTLSAALGPVLLLTGVVGCGSGEGRHAAVYPVEGQVIRDGQPLDGAMVTFYFQGKHDAKFRSPRARTDAEGRFRLGTYDAADGAPEGDYAVCVVHIPMEHRGDDLVPGLNDLSPAYANPKTTALQAQIKKGPNALPPFSLSLAKP
jgi:hypothetical protein